MGSAAGTLSGQRSPWILFLADGINADFRLRARWLEPTHSDTSEMDTTTVSDTTISDTLSDTSE